MKTLILTVLAWLFIQGHVHAQVKSSEHQGVNFTSFVFYFEGKVVIPDSIWTPNGVCVKGAAFSKECTCDGQRGFLTCYDYIDSKTGKKCYTLCSACPCPIKP